MNKLIIIRLKTIGVNRSACSNVLRYIVHACAIPREGGGWFTGCRNFGGDPVPQPGFTIPRHNRDTRMYLPAIPVHREPRQCSSRSTDSDVVFGGGGERPLRRRVLEGLGER